MGFEEVSFSLTSVTWNVRAIRELGLRDAEGLDRGEHFVYEDEAHVSEFRLHGETLRCRLAICQPRAGDDQFIGLLLRLARSAQATIYSSHAIPGTLPTKFSGADDYRLFPPIARAEIAIQRAYWAGDNGPEDLKATCAQASQAYIEKQRQ